MGNLSTSVARDEDCLIQQMIVRSRHHHRTAGIRRHIQFLDAQRVDGEGVVMWWCSLVRTRSVISVIAEIGAALHGPSRQDGAVFDAGSLGKFVNRRRQVIDNPVPPSRGSSRTSGSNNVTTKLFVPGGTPVHCNGGDIFPPVHPRFFSKFGFALGWRR
jgi:hypothetical protein